MQLNGDKFEAISIGSSEREVIYTTPSGEPIEVKNTIKDLGIEMQDNLSFQAHIATVVAKGHTIANWTLRQFVSRDMWTLKILLKQLVVPQVEYGNVLWGPYDQGQINLIEQVQKRYTRRIDEFQIDDEERPGKKKCNVRYPERLKRLKIFPLERRRERYAILYMYKILIGYAPSVGLEHYSSNRGTHVFRSKVIPDNRGIPSWIKKARNSSLFVKGPLLYNGLPSELRTNEMIETPTKHHIDKFKIRLDKYLESVPDVPGTQDNTLLEAIPALRRGYQHAQLI